MEDESDDAQVEVSIAQPEASGVQPVAPEAAGPAEERWVYWTRSGEVECHPQESSYELLEPAAEVARRDAAKRLEDPLDDADDGPFCPGVDQPWALTGFQAPSK